jgi:hypothetical protein
MLDTGQIFPCVACIPCFVTGLQQVRSAVTYSMSEKKLPYSHSDTFTAADVLNAVLQSYQEPIYGQPGQGFPPANGQGQGQEQGYPPHGMHQVPVAQPA